MTPKKFVYKYYPFALEAEKDTGIPAIAIMAQAALESGWGKRAIGNNIFGIKKTGQDCDFQKVLTTEYSTDKNNFEGFDIESMVFDEDKNLYEFKVWQNFADYPTPKEAFLAHSQLLLTDRYKSALRWRYSPVRYLVEIWRLGYATDPDYEQKMGNMVKSIKRRLPDKVREIIREIVRIKSIEAERFTENPDKEVELEEKLKNRIK